MDHWKKASMFIRDRNRALWYAIGCIKGQQRAVSYEEASAIASNFAVPYYEVDLTTGMNAVEVIESMTREILNKEPIVAKAKRHESFKGRLKRYFKADPSEGLFACGAIAMCLLNVLSLFLATEAIIGQEQSLGIQSAIYIGCLALFIAVIIGGHYGIEMIYSDFRKTMVILALSIVDVGIAFGVPIWRLVVDPSQRLMIGLHVAAYIVISPILLIAIHAFLAYCLQRQ